MKRILHQLLVLQILCIASINAMEQESITIDISSKDFAKKYREYYRIVNNYPTKQELLSYGVKKKDHTEAFKKELDTLDENEGISMWQSLYTPKKSDLKEFILLTGLKIIDHKTDIKMVDPALVEERFTKTISYRKAIKLIMVAKEQRENSIQKNGSKLLLDYCSNKIMELSEQKRKQKKAIEKLEQEKIESAEKIEKLEKQVDYFEKKTKNLEKKVALAHSKFA